MTFSSNRRYIPEIDQIRAFAALLVLFYHGLQLIGAQLAHGSPFDPSKDWLFPRNPLLAIIEEGHSGVSLFIVLSGFILSVGAIGNTVQYGPFLLARVLRIYPLLVLCGAFGAYVGRSTLDSFLTSLLPLNMPGGIASNFAAMFWAVAVEFQCYFVFPFLILFSNKRGSVFLVQLIAVAIIFRAVAVLAEGVNPRDISYWTVLGRIDQFCIGIIAARLTTVRGPGAIWFLPSALLAGAMLVVFNKIGGWPQAGIWKIVWPTAEGCVWACFIVTYPAAGRLLPELIGRLGAALGEVSYSLYLVHFVVIALVIRQGLFVRLTANPYYDALATSLLIVLPLTLAIAILTYNTIELPFLRMRPKYIAALKPEG